MKVDIGVAPIGFLAQDGCLPENPQAASLGSEAGWTTEGSLVDGVTSRLVGAEHAGFRFCVIGYFADPHDPTIFDRIIESFRFSD